MLEVRADNATAVRLYTSIGFTQTGLRKAFYADGCAAVLMERPPGPLPYNVKKI